VKKKIICCITDGIDIHRLCNNADLKKLSQVLSGQTSDDSSAFLNAMCFFKVCTQL
jgi:hypothetical protein